MPDPQLIGPVPEATPADPSLTRNRISQVPYDVLKEASKRLEIMSLLAAVLWLLATTADKVALFVMSHGEGIWRREPTTDVIALVSIAASLGLFFYIRKGDRDPQFILDLGHVYMVFTAAALGLLMHWSHVPKDWPANPMISWIGAVVLMSAAIVPNSPMKTLVASLIAVSMNPIGMLIARARGSWDFGPVSNVLIMHYPDYLLVGVAVVISRVMTKLGQQVTKAREMGSYRLVSLLGKGGMGEVWRARHHMLARDAAIKLIQPDMMSGKSGSNSVTIRRRFEQEAKTTASLRSPHTVELYDFGVTKDGVFYYVMELLDGIDLETLVKKFGPQPPARVASILRQVCRSLGDAHGHGMIHRDIKPTNIFLCRMGNEYDFAKVLDFGLVKVLDEQETQITLDGATTGTPAFMAPEMAMGNSPVDGRTDLYGLGCVAYWLTTGSLVFEEKGATAMLLAHLQKTPVAPSKRTQTAVPASLDRAIMMCLAKDPAQRPASADAMVRMLEDSDGIGSWTSEDAERWWRTHMPGEVSQNAAAELPTLASPDALPTL
ncbi:MAG: serine/threonine protein kinase [Acidobacteria bacterium]|nr:serine/threonine protein kinase [Acidobacteriota bacterium]